jgi:hypothetical protein
MEMRLFEAYDKHLEQLTEIGARVCRALEAAGIEYRIIGGLAVFYYVVARDPLLARLTKDVDLAVNRADLDSIAAAVRPHGLEYRHVAGVDMIVDSQKPTARSAVHFVFVGEKVRQEYLFPVPAFSKPERNEEGYKLVPIPDLLKMKLTSFRLVDKTHVVDMDTTGLITPAIEQQLPAPLLERLRKVRSEERQSSGAE